MELIIVLNPLSIHIQQICSRRLCKHLVKKYRKKHFLKEVGNIVTKGEIAQNSHLSFCHIISKVVRCRAIRLALFVEKGLNHITRKLSF